MEKEITQNVFQAHDYEQVDQLIQALFDNSNSVRYGETRPMDLSMPPSSLSNIDYMVETQNKPIGPVKLAFA